MLAHVELSPWSKVTEDETYLIEIDPSLELREKNVALDSFSVVLM